MGALNLSSATDVERLERRLRSFSERLEDIEEQFDELSRQIGALRRANLAKDGADSPAKKEPKAAKPTKPKPKV